MGFRVDEGILNEDVRIRADPRSGQHAKTVRRLFCTPGPRAPVRARKTASQRTRVAHASSRAERECVGACTEALPDFVLCLDPPASCVVGMASYQKIAPQAPATARRKGQTRAVQIASSQTGYRLFWQTQLATRSMANVVCLRSDTESRLECRISECRISIQSTSVPLLGFDRGTEISKLAFQSRFVYRILS